MFSFYNSILCVHESFVSLCFDFVVYMYEKCTFPFYSQPKIPQFVDHRRVLCLKFIGDLRAAFSRRRDLSGSTLFALRSILIMLRRAIFVECLLRAESAVDISIILTVELGCIVLECVKV